MNFHNRATHEIPFRFVSSVCHPSFNSKLPQFSVKLYYIVPFAVDDAALYIHTVKSNCRIFYDRWDCPNRKANTIQSTMSMWMMSFDAKMQKPQKADQTLGKSVEWSICTAFENRINFFLSAERKRRIKMWKKVKCGWKMNESKWSQCMWLPLLFCFWCKCTWSSLLCVSALFTIWNTTTAQIHCEWMTENTDHDDNCYCFQECCLLLWFQMLENAGGWRFPRNGLF